MSFKRLEPEDFLISNDSITAGAWTGNIPTLEEFSTSSAQKDGASGEYYLDVYQTSSGDASADVQFAIAFGDKLGSGSALYDPGIDNKSPSATVYGQFQNLILGDENTDFTFGDKTPVRQTIYALSVERSKYKGSIFTGTLDLKIAAGGSDVLTLTDNSNDIQTVSFNEAGRVYQIISGSNGSAYSGTGYTTDSGSYGLFLPDVGVLLLNGSALDNTFANGGCDLGTVFDTNTDNQNPVKLFEKITTAANFTLNSQENLTSDYIFVRARNSEYNYSENPSFSSGSEGDVTFTSFINAPQTFITSIGLYNDSNDLLAVAKLSKPLKKDFTKEALIRVKLDF